MSHSTLRRSALTCALLSVLFAPLAQAADASADQPQAEQPQAEQPRTEPAPSADRAAATRTPTEIDKVTVTGSRIKRAEIEGPAPVFTITAAQIEKEGFNTVYDALTTLTEAMGTVESDIAWGQHTVNASPLNLRNMGPGRSGDNWSVTYALQYFKREALPAGERGFMDSDFDAPPRSLNPQDRTTGILPSTGIRMLNADTGMRLAPPPGACDQFNGEFFLQNRRTYNRNSNTINNTGWQCG
ncbi:MAG: hypothetical protein JF591_19795, partial [Lysobacter sp.]|nr:hypothetical protein [Lysobacter sp.]